MGGIEALLLLGGFTLLYFGNKAYSAGNLTFFPHRFTGMAFEGITPVATIELIVQNTSNTDFTLNSLSGNVLVQNTLVGNVGNFSPVYIPGNSETVIPLKIRFLLISLVDDIIAAFQTGHFDKELVFDGTVNANGVQVPLNLTYKIG